MQVIWTVKHKHIGDAFFDLDAAAFLCTQLPTASSAAQISESQQAAEPVHIHSNGHMDHATSDSQPSVTFQHLAAHDPATHTSAAQEPSDDRSETQASAARQSPAHSSGAESQQRQAGRAGAEQLPQRCRQQRRGTQRHATQEESRPESSDGIGHKGLSHSKSTVKESQVLVWAAATFLVHTYGSVNS